MQLQTIQEKIYEIRGLKVMFDFDLAELYETETKYLKRAVRSNIRRFPSDFMFELTEKEWESLRCNFSTLESGRGKHPKYLPFVFTEQGVAMLSGVINSQKAIDVNISIMRVFVTFRNHSLSTKEISDKLQELERKFNIQFKDVYEAINFLIQKDKKQIDQSNRTKIGFKSN